MVMLSCGDDSDSIKGREQEMKAAFNIAESGGGSYRPLAILRWVMVVIFVSFGMQKFTLQSAQGIVQFISNSPFISWLSVFGFRGEAYLLGCLELGIAGLLFVMWWHERKERQQTGAGLTAPAAEATTDECHTNSSSPQSGC